MSMSSAHADSEKKHLPEPNWGEPENAVKKREGTEKGAEGKAGTKQPKSKTDGPLRINWKQQQKRCWQAIGAVHDIQICFSKTTLPSSTHWWRTADRRKRNQAAPPSGWWAQRGKSIGNCIETDWASVAQITETAALDQVSDEGEMWRRASAQGRKLFPPLSFWPS